jgi:predicted lipoprotein with Yx(FWY)xxD motif
MRRVLAAIAVVAGLPLALRHGARGWGAATVKTRHGKLGTFLVDGKGRTLYLFEKDKTRRAGARARAPRHGRR